MPGPCRYPVISNPAPSKLPPIWLYLLWSWKPPSNNHPFGLSKYQHMAAETRHISPTEYKRVKQRAKVGGEFRYSPLEISQSSPDSKKLPRPKHSAAITQLSVFSPSGWGTGKHRSSELETVFNYPDYAGLNLVAVVSEVSWWYAHYGFRSDSRKPAGTVCVLTSEARLSSRQFTFSQFCFTTTTN